MIDLDNLVSPRAAPAEGEAAADPAAERLRRYFEAQWAEVAAARTRFLLWDYFDLEHAEALDGRFRKPPATWTEIIIRRMALWATRLQHTADNRFVIEKDKCAMFRMLEDLDLPHPRVRLTWRADDYGDGKRLEAYLLGDAAGAGVAEKCAFPAILKVGHIHQQKSTIFLASKRDVRKRVGEYVAWTTDKMKTKFVDSASWARQTNPLYASIDPCLIVQDVVNPDDFAAGENAARRPLEMMVEVLWGRSIQGVLTVDAEGELVLGRPQYKNTAEFFVLRDGWAAYKWPYLSRDGKFFSRRYTNPRSHVRAHRKARESWFRYAGGEGDAASAAEACAGARDTEAAICAAEYAQIGELFRRKYAAAAEALPEVWKTCDALARGIGADYVRCDVFVAPDGAVTVNEISLSSNWGNAVSAPWQKELVQMWLRGYGGKECVPFVGVKCGAAFAGVFDGNIPSPFYRRSSDWPNDPGHDGSVYPV